MKLLVSSLFIFLATVVHAINRAEISVVGQTEVLPNQAIVLSDLARMSGSTNLDELAEIEILPAMKDGEMKKFSSSEISKIIKKAISEARAYSNIKYTVFAPSLVMIKSRENAISAIKIENKISAILIAKCDPCKVIFKDIKVPSLREVISNCSLQTENLKLAGSFLVPYSCRTPNAEKTYWISGSLKITKSAPVAARQLIPGERISSKDIRVDEVDITFAKDSVISTNEIEGQVANRYLAVNQPIFKSDLRRELAVTRGQLIRAVSGNDSFEVSSQAMAEEQGYVGDIIKIKNSESQKIISGQIVEKGVVKVQ